MKEHTTHAFTRAVGLAMTVILLVTFLMTLLGIIDLRVVEAVALPPILNALLATGMFMLNMAFLFSITLRVFDSRLITIILGYVPVYLLFLFVPFDIMERYGAALTILSPTIYLLVILKADKRLTENNSIPAFLISSGVYWFMTLLFQQLFEFIKLDGFAVTYGGLNALSNWLYRADQWLLQIYLLMEVFTCVKVFGVDYPLRVSSHIQSWFIAQLRGLLSKTNSVSTQTEQTSGGITTHGDDPFATLSKQERAIVGLKMRGFLLMQIIVVLLIGFCHNLLIEAAVMGFVVLVIGNRTLKVMWHSDTLFLCNVVTFGGFYILFKLTLPITQSLFYCVAVSAAFTYLMHKAGVKQAEQERIHAERDALAHDRDAARQFKLVVGCDVFQLRDVCTERGIEPLVIEMMVDKFCVRLEPWKLEEKYRYTIRTINKKIAKAAALLNK